MILQDPLCEEPVGVKNCAMNHGRRWDRIREKGKRADQEGRELTKKNVLECSASFDALEERHRNDMFMPLATTTWQGQNLRRSVSARKMQHKETWTTPRKTDISTIKGKEDTSGKWNSGGGKKGEAFMSNMQLLA